MPTDLDQFLENVEEQGLALPDQNEEDETVPRISREEEKMFREMFDQYDKENAGFILTSKLGEVLRACNQIPTEAWLRDNILQVDPDGTGRVSYDDFFKLAEKLIKGSDKIDEHLLEAFRRFDKDSTGYIACKDLRDVLTTLGDVLDEDEIEEFFKEADPLSQGRVGYENLVQVLCYGPD